MVGLERLELIEEVVEREWAVEDIPVLSARISLPRPAEEGKDRRLRRIDRYYRQFCRSYLRYCDGFLFPRAAAEFRQAAAAGAPLPQFTAQLSYHVTHNEGGLLSLYADSRERGLLPLTVRRGDTWDLRTGTPVALSDFFPPRTLLRRSLPALAQADIQRQLDAGTAAYREDWQKWVRRAFCSGNYYITPEALCIFYQMYALAPAAEGIPVFRIPWGDLGAQRPGFPEPATAP